MLVEPEGKGGLFLYHLHHKRMERSILDSAVEKFFKAALDCLGNMCRQDDPTAGMGRRQRGRRCVP